MQNAAETAGKGSGKGQRGGKVSHGVIRGRELKPFRHRKVADNAHFLFRMPELENFGNDYDGRIA
jgi:hypothetical protein